MGMADTIFAPASAKGNSGVAVIRISGPRSHEAVAALRGGPVPALRRAALRKLCDPEDGSVLDEALILLFGAGSSFTGENVTEIQCHGSPAVVAAIIAALGSLEGLRLAEPGEFTRRAFDAGRLDMAQVEGLADLIDAETDAQRRAALTQYDGALGERCRDWSRRMTRALALIEATIDFADEEIPDETYDVAVTLLREVMAEIESNIADSHLVERLRDGWRVALIGPPNAGKSSLINALARRDVAITSEIAGTTRDSIEVALDLAGYPVTVIDTAGMRLADDRIEALGIERARKMAETADLRVLLQSPDTAGEVVADDILRAGDLRVWNKADLMPPPDERFIAVSALEGVGLERLVEALRVALDLSAPNHAGLYMRERHVSALRDAVGSLRGFMEIASERPDALRETPEIAAEEIRVARNALGRITGESGVEALLDVIFGEFCLGK